MARRMRAPVQRAAGIVILDLQMIAAGLVKINRVGEVRALRFGNLAEAILVFVRFDIFPRTRKSKWLSKVFSGASGPPSWTIMRQAVLGCLIVAWPALRSTICMASRSVNTGRVSSSERHS